MGPSHYLNVTGSTITVAVLLCEIVPPPSTKILEHYLTTVIVSWIKGSEKQLNVLMSTKLCCGIPETMCMNNGCLHTISLQCVQICTDSKQQQLKLCVCVSFNTKGMLAFRAFNSEKTQRHLGAACFHVPGTKCMNLACYAPSLFVHNRLFSETIHAQTPG